MQKAEKFFPSFRILYGPGGLYALFTGRDASRALALMSFDLTGNKEGLSASELEVLRDWEYKFMENYVKVWQIVPSRNDNGNEDDSKTNENESQENITEGNYAK